MVWSSAFTTTLHHKLFFYIHCLPDNSRNSIKLTVNPANQGPVYMEVGDPR